MMFLFRDDQSGVISNVVLRGKCAGKNQNQPNKKTSPEIAKTKMFLVFLRDYSQHCLMENVFKSCTQDP